MVYVEEPRIEIGPPRDVFEVTDEAPNLQVARLVLSSDEVTFRRRLDETRDATGGHPFAVSERIERASLMFESREQGRLEREVVRYVESWRSGPLVLWLYTPLVVGFIDLLSPDLVVYDVMDDLASFRYAQARLRQQEQELVTRADLLLAGGPSLYEARRTRHPNAHLFPSGVDEAHFARAASSDVEVPEDIGRLPRPVIGYFGVIDERIDYELLASVARARPEWSWVMIGPLLKVREAEIPRLPNLHFLGKRPYEELPANLAGFDVAMMPFAINEATRSISPTKTLEYMAGHKPVVSTPVPDVMSLYGEVVRIADTPERFVEQVEAALGEDEPARQARAAVESELLARYSWDRIVEEIDGLLEKSARRSPKAALVE